MDPVTFPFGYRNADIWSEPDARPEDGRILLTVTTANLFISLTTSPT